METQSRDEDDASIWNFKKFLTLFFRCSLFALAASLTLAKRCFKRFMYAFSCHIARWYVIVEYKKAMLSPDSAQSYHILHSSVHVGTRLRFTWLGREHILRKQTIPISTASVRTDGRVPFHQFHIIFRAHYDAITTFFECAREKSCY